MKNILPLSLLALTLFAAQPALAVLPQKLASVNELESDARNFSLMIGEGQECALKIQRFDGGIRLGMISEEGLTWLDVRNDSAVVLTQSYQDDGSYVREYEIPGQGKLTALTADDSYFHASLEANGKKVNCELDF
ncbi:MAG: hypothetical protein AB7K68_09355 [Bacteriovoracia bacterium]